MAARVWRTGGVDRVSTATLFVHSTGTWPSMWTPYFPIFAPLGETLALAHIGYQPNPIIPRGTSVTAVDDAEAIVERLPPDITDIHLVTHSYGGVIAFELMRLLGAQVRSLFLYEPVLFNTLIAAPDGDVTARTELQALANNPAFLHNDATGGDEQWIQYFIDFWNRPGSWARMPADKQHEVRAIGWKMFQEARNVFRHEVSLDAIVNADIPVTLAYGDRTPSIARAVIDLLSSRLPSAHRIEVQGTGHMGPLTHPAPVADALTTHAQRVRAATWVHAPSST